MMETQTEIIHARFAPNGTVVEISERPPELTPQDWFDFLSEKVGGKSYRALSGGRGVFRLSKEQIASLKTESATRG